MGARKDQSTSFSCLTQEEVEAFCLKWGIDPRFNPEALGLDKSIDQCPKGSIALFCKNFEFSNLRYPFSTFVLNVMEYYRRHPDAVLNELEPSEDELDSWFLKSIRACPSRLRPFPEPLLVLMGISTLWDKPDRDPMLMRDGQVMHFVFLFMSALDFLKSDDILDVVFADAASTEGEDTMAPALKQSTHRSTQRKGAGQTSTSEMIDLGDELDVEGTEVLDGGKKCELRLVAGKDAKAAGKKVRGSKPPTKTIKSSSNVDQGEIYVSDWKVTVSDTFKSPTICEDVLNHFAHPAREAMKANIAALKKDKEGFVEKELAWQKKVHELTQRHEDEIGELKQQAEALSKEKEELEVSMAQLAKDNKWLIEQGFQQVVTYLLHSSEFNSGLAGVYLKLLIHGRHQGYIIGYDAGVAGSPKDKSPFFHPGAFDVFKDHVMKMERMTYPFVGEVSDCYGKPLSVLQGLKPRGLNEDLCNEILQSVSKKRSHSRDSEDTFSEGVDASKDSSLEASEVAAAGRKKKKAKKAPADGGKKDDASKKDDATNQTNRFRCYKVRKIPLFVVFLASFEQCLWFMYVTHFFI
ncbi:hypothetical protein HanPI659440_Chr13g0502421 [Helianthus annuus]|nr:hypothetical protein HanPI659440_Chr13g0502421 [Helianthus annuus]